MKHYFIFFCSQAYTRTSDEEKPKSSRPVYC